MTRPKGNATLHSKLDQGDEKGWAEPSQLSTGKKGGGDGISTMQTFQNTEEKGNTICKRTIKDSVGLIYTRFRKQSDEKEDYQVKETMEG